MWGMQGMRGMSTRIPGNLLEDSGERSRFGIPGNVREDSGECSKRFRGMFERFRGMFRKILGNAFNFKLTKAAFYCDLALLYLMKQ